MAQTEYHEATGLKPERGRLSRLEAERDEVRKRWNQTSTKLYIQQCHEEEAPPEQMRPWPQQRWDYYKAREAELGEELRRLNDEIASIRSVDVRL